MTGTAARNLSFKHTFKIKFQRLKLHTYYLLVKTALNSTEFDITNVMLIDKLEIAFSSSPRTLDVPGAQLENICYLRTPNDANAIGKMTVSLFLKLKERLADRNCDQLGVEKLLSYLCALVFVCVIFPLL